MTSGDKQTKPSGAWTAEQTVEYMFEKVLIEGDFYVICPDNETTSVSNCEACRFQADTRRPSTRPVSSGRLAILLKIALPFRAGILHVSRGVTNPLEALLIPPDEARFDEFVTGKQGLSARSRSRGRLERIPDGVPA
jgi:hypothetical protein